MEIGIQTNTEVKRHKVSKREKIELFMMIGIMLVSVLLLPQLKGIVSILPLGYFFIERRLRKRNREGNGLSFANLPKLLRGNMHLILLVGVGMQLCYLYMYAEFFPQVLKHVLSRTPLDLQDVNAQLFLSLLVFALGEEIVFRGFIQARLTCLVPTWAAILVTSVLFAVMHLSTGAAAVVVPDLVTVFLDSILFGWIFARTHNIYASTAAHFLANTVATLSIYFLMI